jgi:hypothetical protein
MALLPPPPINEPESLRELAVLVNHSLVTITNSLEGINARIDNLVTLDKHRSDMEKVQADITALRAEWAQARSRTRWIVTTVIAVLAIVVPVVVTLLGH